MLVFPHPARTLRQFQLQFASEEACQEYLAAGPRATSAHDARTIAVTRAGGTKTLAVRRLSSPSVPDIGDNPSQYEDPADPLVLGGLPDDDRQARRLGVASPAPAWSSALRNRLDDTAQAPASDGECGARAASRRGRNRRYLGWRHPGRDPREPPAQGAPRGTRRGSRGEARKSFWAYPYGSHPRLQGDDDQPLHHAERCSGLDHSYRWPQKLYWPARDRLRAHPSHSAAENRIEQRHAVDGATRRSRHRQPPAMAHRHSSRGQPRATPGLPRRVRLEA